MLRRALAADAGNQDLRRRLTIAERILAKSHYYEIAREFGRLVGEANSGHPAPHTVIMTGAGARSGSLLRGMFLRSAIVGWI